LIGFITGPRRIEFQENQTSATDFQIGKKGFIIKTLGTIFNSFVSSGGSSRKEVGFQKRSDLPSGALFTTEKLILS
jgi:hypothetical protein